MSNTKTNTEWSSREVGAFWKNKGRTTGQTYLSGHVVMEDEETGAKRRIKLVVFPNKFKEENEKAPDFHIYLSKDKEDEGSDSQQTPAVTKPEMAEDLM